MIILMKRIKKKVFDMIKKFISYYKPHWKLFALDMLCAFAVSACDLFYPTITGNIIDDYIPNRELRLLIIWGIALLFIFILKAVLNYVIQFYGHCVGVRMQADMRRDIFKHMQKLPFSFFDSNKTGSIMSRIINDLMDISELAHHGPENLFTSGITLIASFIILCFINPWLTLMVFAMIPLLIIFSAKMRGRQLRAFTKTREEIAVVNSSLENSISGIRVSKAFTSSEHEEGKFEEGNTSFLNAREFAYKTMAEFHSGMSFLTDMLNLIVMVGGGIFCYLGKISAGEFVKYLLYINVFLTPIRRIIDFIEQYQNGMSGFKRFLEILYANPEKENPNAVDVPHVDGDIKFDQVTFSYSEDERTVLSQISLNIKHGQTVAFVGPSGSGKTTLCHLIPRFYDISGGEILIDDRNIHDFTLESLRGNIGIVQQDVFLFTGSVRDNISYGNFSASNEDIVTAAKLANIHDYIVSLPDGYDTYIGERGVKLSGGQKQRISIARIFLKNPPILILDEATSALDTATELAIQDALERLSKDKTTLIVAHRLSTIKNADCIVVLTENGVAEQGSHDELLAEDGVYKNLYNSQFTINSR